MEGTRLHTANFQTIRSSKISLYKFVTPAFCCMPRSSDQVSPQFIKPSHSCAADTCSATMASPFAIATASITEAMAKFNFLLTLGPLMGLLWTRNHPQNAINDSGCTKVMAFLYATSFCFIFSAAMFAEATRLTALSGIVGGRNLSSLRLSAAIAAFSSACGLMILSSAVLVEAHMQLSKHVVACNCQNPFASYCGMDEVLPLLILLPVTGLLYYLIAVFRRVRYAEVDILDESWE